MSYDSNGNILKLERFGKKQVNQGIELDDLTYTYEGNMLKKVVDATNNTDGFKQGTHTGDDYTYDTFGNLKTDKNKGITNIKYNHLNLPVEITFGNGKIEYIYSSGGAKVQKKVTQGTTVTTTDYLGGFTASVRVARVNTPTMCWNSFQHQKGITMLEIAGISH